MEELTIIMLLTVAVEVMEVEVIQQNKSTVYGFEISRDEVSRGYSPRGEVYVRPRDRGI